MKIKITEIPKDVTLDNNDNNDNNAVYNWDNKVLGITNEITKSSV